MMPSVLVFRGFCAACTSQRDRPFICVPGLMGGKVQLHSEGQMRLTWILIPTSAVLTKVLWFLWAPVFNIIWLESYMLFRDTKGLEVMYRHCEHNVTYVGLQDMEAVIINDNNSNSSVDSGSNLIKQNLQGSHRDVWKWSPRVACPVWIRVNDYVDLPVHARSCVDTEVKVSSLSVTWGTACST